MAEQKDWSFPAELRPKPEEWRFDLDAALDSVVQLRSEIPDDAFTAPLLGTERAGNGVVISENGMVLTIGYLILEAEEVQITTSKGRTVPATVAAYDHATGFGLLRPLGPLDVKPIVLGNSASVDALDRVLAWVTSQKGMEWISV